VIAPDSSLETDCMESVEDGVTVFRVRTGQIEGASRFRRGWNEMRLSPVLWSAGRDFFRDHPCDLIAFYSPTIFFGPLVRRLKELWACRSYMILRDIFPQWAVDAGALRKGPAYLYFKRHERLQYAASDVIALQSPGNLRYFEERGWHKKYRLEVLYNWTALEAPAPAQVDYRKAWGLEGKVVFVYGGNIGVAQDMDNLLRLAEALRADERIVLLLVGEGSEVPRLRALAAAKGLRNFQVRDAVSQAEYAGMVGQFDVGLISLHRGLKTQNFPGKMLSYFLVSLPVLASINPGNDLQTLLEKEQAGLVSENGEDARLADQARRLAGDEKFRRETGARGRLLLDKLFSAANAARQILSSVPPKK
jgi:glycosyltransferase involved in cell wall biosynthesis